MKAYTYSNSGLKLFEVHRPIVKDNELLVKIQWASVCGSDYPYITGSGERKHLIGAVIGHEGSGVVISTGRKVTKFSVGDNVAFESHRARPEWLEQGNDPYTDPNAAIIGYRGVGRGKPPQGTFAEYISVPEIYAHKIPGHLVTVLPGSLWEPIGNGLRMVNTLKREVNNAQTKIVVSGCGFQGLMTMLLLRYYLGYQNVYGIDINKHRLELAHELGLSAYNPNELSVPNIDVWLEMSGAIPAFQNALELVKPSGYLFLFGIPNQDIKIGNKLYRDFVLEGMRTVMNNRKLIGVVGRLREDWEMLPDAIEKLSKKTRLSKLYYYAGPLDNFIDAVNSKLVPPGPELKILKVVFSSFHN